MKVTRDKVVGCFLGVAIGDALGMPVETYSATEVAERYGRLTHYRVASGHKWYDGEPKGTTTDDWQLSKAVARGIIQAGGKLDMNAVAAEHVTAYHQSVKGWGKTTREAVEALAAGAPWRTAGRTDKPNRGTGNGVAMKVTPVGAYMAIKNPDCHEPKWSESVEFLVNLAKLTHWTSMGVSSGFCQALAVFKCLLSDPADFRRERFIQTLVGAALMGQQYLRETLGPDDLHERLKLLYRHEEYDPQRIAEEFNGGCYIYHSLPFAYMFFVRNPHSIESLYDCVSAGGDADTNGSMVAALLGALHGPQIFPQHLVDELPELEVVSSMANDFCDALGL